ncbi:23963_t:CDS:2, partial [Gigaspora margarita]
NLFDYYLENAPPDLVDPAVSPISGPSTKATSSFITPRQPVSRLSNLSASPILQREGTSFFITHCSAITRLEPEDLDDSLSLPPYNEDTTFINFPPRRNFLPTSSPNPLTQFLNFITPARLNNPPPPPYHTVYSIHLEKTDPVPPVIVDIDSPNVEPARTPIPEALVVNQPDP